MTTATCLWPHRHPTTGRFCRTRGAVKVPEHPHALCPHHIGVLRAPHTNPETTEET